MTTHDKQARPITRPAPYAWVITFDRIDNGAANGTAGPRNASDALIARATKHGKLFTMSDDDGQHYYTGYIIGDYSGFEPLDDYGTPNAGCTEIRYNGRVL